MAAVPRPGQRKTLKTSSPEQLAGDLATKLAISDPNAKLASMRAVNAASQTLSGIVQSGWKKSTAEASSKATLTSAISAATSAAKYLKQLRGLAPGEVDVERAAISVLGKLVVLEMFDLAEPALAQMHPRLCTILGASELPPSHLCLPRDPTLLTDPIILNIVATYLTYALVIQSQSQAPEAVVTIAENASLLEWLPVFSSLPAKSMDALLTRTYTSLNKLCNKTRSAPQAVFKVRIYALRCLAHTSPGVIAANTFWDQAIKCGASLVKVTPKKCEEEATKAVLSSFNELVQLAQSRSDSTTFVGVGGDCKAFVDFCEYWMSFAKRGGDVAALQRIDALIKQPSSSTPPASPRVSPVPVRPQEINLEGTKICTSLNQLSLLLEDVDKPDNNDDTLLESIKVSTTLLRTSIAIAILLEPVSKATTEKSSRQDAELRRMRGKVDRAFETCRRTALKRIESLTSAGDGRDIPSQIKAALHEFASQCVHCLEPLVSRPDLSGAATRDIVTRCLDTLFVLSRDVLIVTSPTTFVPAFDHLAKAATILDAVPADKLLSQASAAPEEVVDVANYLRCVSGAFYNIAGSLYQAMRYGNAVPFLVESCILGGKALSFPRPPPSSSSSGEAREKEWTQLEEQIGRRWELLGVCYSKNGDRKNSYDAFKHAIYAFPFASSGLTAAIDQVAPDALFGSDADVSPGVKQLVALVDRVSYLGACDLMLPAEEVSFLSAPPTKDPHPDSISRTGSRRLDPSIAGALIERQLDGLEPSRWKEDVRTVFIRLLLDALHVYTTEGSKAAATLTPVRKARVLVRCMEFAYRDHDDRACEKLGFMSVEDIGAEVEQLLTVCPIGNDAALARFIPQYRVTAHLWIALYTHRCADPEQFTLISQRAEEASRLIRELLSTSSDSGVTAPSKAAPATTAAAARGAPSSKKAVKSPKAPRVVASPKVTRVTRQRTPAAPRKGPPVRTRGKATPADPVTPKARPRTVLPEAVKTPPRVSLPRDHGAKSPLVFDKFESFMSLLQLSCRILGFLSLTLTKVGLLDMTRRLARRQMATKNDGYVIASLDLAHEYALLGKYKRAANIFNQALDIVRSGQVPEEVSVGFLLRYAELLAMVEDVPKSSQVYLEALERSKQLDLERNASSTQQRIRARAKLLEITAAAAHVFALIQFEHGDASASLDGLLQALRLWNRSIDTLSRLNPPRQANAESAEADPFAMTALKEALPSAATGGSSQGDKVSGKALERHAPMDGMEWQVSEGLLSTMLLLAQTYYLRGSAREALYFSKQAADLAESLNAPTLKGRAMAIQGEIQLHMGSWDEAHASIAKAAEILCNIPGIDTVNITRITIELKSRQSEQAEVSYADVISMLDELDNSFRQLDSITFGARRSLGLSPSTVSNPETLAPRLMVSLLSQQIWQMRDDVDDNFNILLEKLVSLAHSKSNKAEESILMAKLTLHGVYDRLRTDLFLGSMTESTIAVPMGMCGRQDVRSSILPSTEVLNALANAERYLRTHLRLTGGKGDVIQVREAATSLALICAFRTSLGDRKVNVAPTMTSLIDMSASLTLRRDMLEAAEHKLRSEQLPDDLAWPLLSANGCYLPPASPRPGPKYRAMSLSDSEDDLDEEREKTSKVSIQDYWRDVRERHRLHEIDPLVLSPSVAVGLPSNWAVININITDDKSTLFVSRQQGGEEGKDPLIFCIPLKGRRDHGNEEDEKEQHLTFADAVHELRDIVRCSDECTKSAVSIKPGDDEARSDWWKQRGRLDVRMRELLENIEYCWLGAFKAILNPQPDLSPQAILDFRTQFEAVFHRALYVKDKKSQKKGPVHKKTSAQPQTVLANQFTLDDEILKCFSTLSPKCQDEEIEDLIYFVLDLYQFHGVPMAIAEVDVTQLVVDLRGVLEEQANNRTKWPTALADEHLFLVLDKNVQGLPWESIPVLRGRSVSRIPGVQFLQDRLEFAKRKRETARKPFVSREGAIINPRNGYYILNPSGDLERTEERFRGWARGMKACGWDGIIGKQLTEQQFISALKSRDLVVYFGHGGGEQYVRSHMVRNLQSCAATMLWGCSSGSLRDNGDFDRTGTPYNYMLAGCPTLVANLWDVTDKDIDKFSQSVFDKLGLTAEEKGPERCPVSLVAAVAQSRGSCKLKYLTGAAPVVYGIPFYL